MIARYISLSSSLLLPLQVEARSCSIARICRLGQQRDITRRPAVSHLGGKHSPAEQVVGYVKALEI